ncbi:hypothetical protein [Xanthomonas arboricola]|uniref:hypothetical protein n=1 Tax=Xanthomonas arboricola TaxID=56448 RepID=UPI0012D33076|nr:hypothetical protein [Xanthomonas arboricola]
MGRLTLVTSKSVGIFNASAWLKEGDGLLASARTTRAAWLVKRRKFSDGLNAAQESRVLPRARSELVGMPRASMLLLGYSVEMYLKAGVVKAYVGCRDGMLERDLKKRFGHALTEIAVEIDFQGVQERANDFDSLRRMILFDSRYPVTSTHPSKYHAELNAQTMRIWNSQNFANLCGLAREVREHVARIDKDRRNPSLHRCCRIDDDGYVALRVGGHLRSRITLRFSSEQHRAGNATLKHMRQLFLKEECPWIENWWDTAEIRHDDERETRIL